MPTGSRLRERAKTSTTQLCPCGRAQSPGYPFRWWAAANSTWTRSSNTVTVPRDRGGPTGLETPLVESHPGDPPANLFKISLGLSRFEVLAREQLVHPGGTDI